MDTTFKRVVHLDEKVIKPHDKVGSIPIMGNESTVTMDNSSVPSRPDGLSKSIIGRPRVYDLKGNLLATEENLVVITGREYLAQMLAMTQGDNPEDLTQYRVTYFAVGDGGASAACPPTTVGPFDDDTDLVSRVVIKDISGVVDPFKYIYGGTLKQITSDGEITVVSEEHTINVPTGGQKVIDAYTAVRYRMYLQANEPKNKPFRFNEAGLFAVKYALDPITGVLQPTYDPNNPNVQDEPILFARFTTMDKYLEAGDGVMIEWYILV